MKKLGLFIVVLVYLTACGGSKKEEEKTIVTDKKAIQQKIKDIEFSNTSIDLKAAFYDGEIEYTKIDPCPFLTDETVAGTYLLMYGLSEKEVRTVVSNTECVWSYLTVRIPSDKNTKYRLNQMKKYNGEDSLKPQSGPGKNAQLYFAKIKNEKKQENPTGFVFTQNGKTIFISGTTGFADTSAKKLRKVADEISKLLPNAPQIKQQYKQVVVRFNTCDIWDKSTLTNLLQTSEVVPPIGQQKLECSYFFKAQAKEGAYSQPRFKIKFSIQKARNGKNACESSIAKGAKAQKGYAQKVVKSMSKSIDEHDPFVSETLIACTDKLTFNLYMSGLDYRYTTQMKQLLENFLGRI